MVGFIGCGNMGGAMARAAAKGLSAGQVLLSDYDRSKSEQLAAQLGGEVSDNETIARTCRYIFLAVKPQMMEQVLNGLSPVLAARTDRFVLISIAAGVTIERIRELSGRDWPVFRMLPNTPVAVGQGIVQFCVSGVTTEERGEILEFMAPAGMFDELPEAIMSAGNGISGCGVAFACLFMEAMADGGVACGLPRDKAVAYAAQTLVGMGALALESGEHFGLLKDRICSPAGATIQGVRALEKGAFRSAAMEAVILAVEKAERLGKS